MGQKGIAYIVDIYVSPEFRSSNAAGLLIKAFAQATEQQYSEIWTNTGIRNKRVQVLLKRAGFEIMDDFEIDGLKDQIYYKKLFSSV